MMVVRLNQFCRIIQVEFHKKNNLVGNYDAARKDEIMQFTETLLELEDIMLSEVSQKNKLISLSVGHRITIRESTV